MVAAFGRLRTTALEDPLSSPVAQVVPHYLERLGEEGRHQHYSQRFWSIDKI